MERDPSIILRIVAEPGRVDLSAVAAKRRERLIRMIAQGEIVNAELIEFATAAKARIAEIKD